LVQGAAKFLSVVVRRGKARRHRYGEPAEEKSTEAIDETFVHHPQTPQTTVEVKTGVVGNKSI